MFTDLILLRLYVAPDRGATPAAIRKDLLPLLDASSARQTEFMAALDSLETEGLVVWSGPGLTRRYSITPQGRKRAQEQFHIGHVAELSWAKARDRFLTSAALGLSPEDAAAMNSVETTSGLRAIILRNEYAPDLRGAPTMAKVLDFLVARCVNARRATPGEIRNALIRKWVAASGEAPQANEEPQEEPAQPDAPLEIFAEGVRQIARETTTGRFGDNKVFISHVWKEVQARGIDDLARNLPAFKKRLVEANTKGLLRLTAADLTGAFFREDLNASETTYLHTIFHFIQI